MSNVVLSLDPGKDWATAKFLAGALSDARFQDLGVINVVDVLVVEFPKVRSNGDANPNAIVRLAWSAGMIAGRVDAEMIAEVPTVAIPKSIVKKRVRDALEAFELDNLDAALARVPAGKQHNVYDAVRHGLVYLGRMNA